jgi:TPR repeat protein
LREGADAGDAEAKRVLGACCYYGYGVPQNYIEAARLFRRLAADQGNAGAQAMHARCYMEGTGVVEDMGEGVRLLTLAAEQGHAPSQIMLANFINRAAGVPAAAVPREAARLLAHDAQMIEDPNKFSDFADDRNVARTCCIGCGQTEQLQVCAKCLTAKFCSRECQRHIWPAHKQACKAWAQQKSAAAAEAGRHSSSAQAESGEA